MALILCILLLVYLVLLACLAKGLLAYPACVATGLLGLAIVLCAKLPCVAVGFSDLPLLAHYNYHYYHRHPPRIYCHRRRSRRSCLG